MVRLMTQLEVVHMDFDGQGMDETVVEEATKAEDRSCVGVEGAVGPQIGSWEAAQVASHQEPAQHQKEHHFEQVGFHIHRADVRSLGATPGDGVHAEEP